MNKEIKIFLKAIYIIVTAIPFLYLWLLMMLWTGSLAGFSAHLQEFLVFIVGMLITLVLSINLIYKNWKKEYTFKTAVVDFIVLLIYHLPSLVALIYGLLKLS